LTRLDAVQLVEAMNDPSCQHRYGFHLLALRGFWVAGTVQAALRERPKLQQLSFRRRWSSYIKKQRGRIRLARPLAAPPIR
jgi:hypothetical protein